MNLGYFAKVRGERKHELDKENIKIEDGIYTVADREHVRFIIIWT